MRLGDLQAFRDYISLGFRTFYAGTENECINCTMCIENSDVEFNYSEFHVDDDWEEFVI